MVGDLKSISSYDIYGLYCKSYEESKSGNERACDNCKHIDKRLSNRYFCICGCTPNISNQT